MVKSKDEIRKALVSEEVSTSDDTDHDIEDYRTDSILIRRQKSRLEDRPWILECLIILSVTDQVLPKKHGDADNFTLTELYHHCKMQAERWDNMFKLKDPFSIKNSFLSRYQNIYAFNTIMFNWVKQEDAPILKTGNKIVSRYSAVPGAPATEYRIHPEVRDKEYLNEYYRERLVNIIERLQFRR